MVILGIRRNRVNILGIRRNRVNILGIRRNAALLGNRVVILRRCVGVEEILSLAVQQIVTISVV